MMAFERAGKAKARSGDTAESSAHFLPDRVGEFDEGDEKKALDFHGSDPAFRIFICSYPVAPVFVIISMVKLFLLLAALFTTVAQLLVVHSESSVTTEQPTNATTFATPKNTDSSWNSGGERSSWASAIFYFEPSWWLALAYVRLTVAIIAIFTVLCGLIGVWRQRRLLLLATAVVDCGLLLFLLVYMVLLAWHAVKYDDYFAFAIGGLALLSFLLISATGLHAAVVTHRYLKSMLAFLSAAKRRWPDAYDEAVTVVRRRTAQWRGIVSIYDRLTYRYDIAAEIMRVESAELAVINRHEPILQAIEEESMVDISQDGEEQKAV